MNRSEMPAQERNVVLSVRDVKISYRVVKPVSIGTLLRGEQIWNIKIN